MTLVVRYTCRTAVGAPRGLPPASVRAVLALARGEGLQLVRAPHEGRPASPVVAAGNPADLVAGVVAAIALEFGVTERFIAVRTARYGLIRGDV